VKDMSDCAGFTIGKIKCVVLYLYERTTVRILTEDEETGLNVC